jgi:hypothetical protein
MLHLTGQALDSGYGRQWGSRGERHSVETNAYEFIKGRLAVVVLEERQGIGVNRAGTW